MPCACPKVPCEPTSAGSTRKPRSTPSKSSSTSSTGTDAGGGRGGAGRGTPEKRTLPRRLRARRLPGSPEDGRFRAAADEASPMICEKAASAPLADEVFLGAAWRRPVSFCCRRDIPRGRETGYFRAVAGGGSPRGPTKTAVLELLRASAAWALAKKAKSMRFNPAGGRGPLFCRVGHLHHPR